MRSYTKEAEAVTSQRGDAMAEKKEQSRKRLLKVLAAAAVSALITAVTVALLVLNVFPVIRIYGDSMSPALFDGDVVITRKTTSLERGDICIFSMNDRILCKRVIGVGGDKISLDENGVVYVNGTQLAEPYLSNVNLGSSTVEYPVTVPNGSYFVMGDNRRTSIDSRNTAVGCVSGEQVEGKLLLRVLPTPGIP